jgi:hypothetical protein
MGTRLAALIAVVGTIGCNSLFGVDGLSYDAASGATGGTNVTGTGGADGAGGTGGTAMGSTVSTGGAGGSAGGGGSGGSPPMPKTLTFQGNDGRNQNGSTYGFTDMPIGIPSADRRIIVGVIANQNNSLVASVTVAEVTAELLDQVVGNGEQVAALAIAHAPDDEIANIVVTFDGGQNRAAIGVWSATGLTSNAPVDVASSSLNPLEVALATEPGGFVVAIAGHVSNNFGTWPVLDVRFMDTVAGHQSLYTGADGPTLDLSTVVSVQGLGNNRRGLVAASF